jgi:hypothetical protein
MHFLWEQEKYPVGSYTQKANLRNALKALEPALRRCPTGIFELFHMGKVLFLMAENTQNSLKALQRLHLAEARILCLLHLLAESSPQYTGTKHVGSLFPRGISNNQVTLHSLCFSPCFASFC